MKDIAHDQDVTLSNMVAKIDSGRQHGNLSSAIRLFVLDGVQRRKASLAAGGVTQ